MPCAGFFLQHATHVLASLHSADPAPIQELSMWLLPEIDSLLLPMPDDAALAKSDDHNNCQLQTMSSLSPATTTLNTTSGSSSSSSSSVSSSDSDSSSSSDSDGGADDSEAPGEVNGNSNMGNSNSNGNDDDDGNSSDSSSSSSLTITSDDDSDNDKEEEDDDDPDSSSDSDESELEAAYPKLPSAPVDALLALRRQEKREELKITVEVKEQIIQAARIQVQERAKGSKPKTSRRKSSTTSSSSKKKKSSGAIAPGSVVVSMVPVELAPLPLSATGAEEEEEWMVHCSCGIQGKNYDDGTAMVQCERCKNWLHTRCAIPATETAVPEHFFCFQCEWMFDCVCGIKAMNHDDFTKMVECEVCQTWQHTLCVGIPDTMDPPDDYKCPRCRPGKRDSKSSRSSSSRSHSKKSSHKSSSSRRSKTGTSAAGVASLPEPAPVPTVTPSSSRRAASKDTLPLPPMPSPPGTPPPPPPSSPPPPPMAPPVMQTNGDSAPPHRRPVVSTHRKRSRSSLSSPPPANKHSSGDTSTESSSVNNRTTSAVPALVPVVDARPSLPIVSPKSAPLASANGSVHSPHHNRNSSSSHHSKRKSGSARDRLEKKLKMKKMR